jgi:hypothetical protein
LQIVPRAVDPADYVTPHGPLATQVHVETGVLDVGLELLREEVAQLIDRDPFKVQNPKAGQIDGAIRSDRKMVSEVRDVEQLNFKNISYAMDVRF